jgi:hypothetical protein
VKDSEAAEKLTEALEDAVYLGPIQVGDDPVLLPTFLAAFNALLDSKEKEEIDEDELPNNGTDMIIELIETALVEGAEMEGKYGTSPPHRRASSHHRHTPRR